MKIKVKVINYITYNIGHIICNFNFHKVTNPQGQKATFEDLSLYGTK